VGALAQPEPQLGGRGGHLRVRRRLGADEAQVQEPGERDERGEREGGSSGMATNDEERR
jgi:hypothetical protein